MIVRKSRFGCQHEAQNGPGDGPVVRVGGEEQRVEQDGHQLRQDVRLRRHVRSDQLHGRLVLALVQEHVRGDMVDSARTMRAHCQFYHTNKQTLGNAGNDTA